MLIGLILLMVIHRDVRYIQLVWHKTKFMEQLEKNEMRNVIVISHDNGSSHQTPISPDVKIALIRFPVSPNV